MVGPLALLLLLPLLLPLLLLRVYHFSLFFITCLRPRLREPPRP